MAVIAAALAFFASHSAAAATTYYAAPISTSCSPAAPGAGTLANPYTNPYYALTQGAVQCGDTLLLRGGTYRASFSGYSSDSTRAQELSACDDDQTPGDNGPYDGTHTLLPLFNQCSASSPLTIENYPGEDVILDGTDADMDSAPGWQRCSDGGDGPGGGNDSCCGATGLSLLAPSETYCTTSFNVSSADTPQLWIDPSPTTPGTRLGWWANTSAVIASDLATDHQTLPRGAFFSVNGGKPLVLRLPDGSNPSGHSVKMAVQGGDGAWAVVAANGGRFVTVRKNPSGGSFRVKFGYYPIYVSGNAQFISFDGVEVIGCGGRDYGNCVRVTNGSNVTFTNGRAQEAMGECFAFYGGGPGGQCSGGTNNGKGCFQDSDCPGSTCNAGNGHGIQTSNNTVSFSRVTQCGRGWIDGGGQGTSLGQGVIVKNCSNCVVRGNNISQTFRNGIQVNTSTECGAGPAPCNSDGVVIDRNWIADYGRFQDLSSTAYPRNSQIGDGTSAGIYVGVNTSISGASSTNNPTISNNLVRGGYSFANTNKATPGGIRLDSNLSGAKLINNSISGVAGTCINLQPVTTNPVTLRNNAMSGCSQVAPACNGNPCDLFVVGTAAHVHSNNTYWASSNVNVLQGGKNVTRDSIVSNWEASAVQADPRFVSATDLHLQAGSPLIGKGTTTDAPTVDCDGEARGARVDIGADQWSSTHVQPPAPALISATPIP